MSHDKNTGALTRDIFQDIPNSASNWKTFLKKKEYHTHPLRYPAGIYNVVGGLGAGKTTAIKALIGELNTIIAEKKLGRVIYYSGSGSDRALEEYDPEQVEIFDRRSKESFLSALKELQAEAQITPHDQKLMNIVVFDDACNDKDLVPTSVKSETELSKLMMQARHIPVAIIISAQKLSSIPPFARVNASHMFAFRTRCPSETKAIIAEANFSKHEVENAMSSLTDNSEFLWFQNADRRLIKGFTEPLVY